MPEVNPGYFQWGGEHALQSAAAYFEENGYAVVTSHATPSETASLRSAAAHIISSFRASQTQTSVFTTVDQVRKMDNSYFLASANNISCFLEERQEPPAPLAVNKIGHALHDLDPVFAAFSHSDKNRAVAAALGVRDPGLIQSMYILKNPRIGGEVSMHRDGAFVRGDPCATGDCLGYWWALEDATLENGCLWAVPGSHRDGRNIRRFVLSEDGKRTAFLGEDELAEYGSDGFVPLPMKAGDLIVIHGSLVHKSLWNRSEKSRHAYSIHVIEGTVPKDCWLQRAGDFPVKPL